MHENGPLGIIQADLFPDRWEPEIRSGRDRLVEPNSAKPCASLHVRPSVRQHGAAGKWRGSGRGMRRREGGLSNKLRALVDADGRPIGLRLTGGQVLDACKTEALRGYSGGCNRTRRQGDMTGTLAARPLRPSMSGQQTAKHRRAHLKRIKQSRGIANRYDRDTANFLASGAPINDSTP